MVLLSEINIENIENISKITLAELKDPKFFSRLKELANEINTHSLLKEANYLLSKITNLLNKYQELAASDPKVYKSYQKLLIYLKFLTLPSQPVSEIENLFKNNLLLALRKNIFLKKYLNILFIVSLDEITGGAIHKKILKSMWTSEEKLSEENMKDQVGNNPLPSFVKNWLKDYDYFFHSEKKARGKLEQITYLNQSNNAKKLRSQEREILIRLIQLYDFLKFPSAEIEVKGTGHYLPPVSAVKPAPKVEDQFVPKEVSASQEKEIRSADDPRKGTEELRNMLNQYPEGSLERKAVEEELKKLEVIAAKAGQGSKK